MRRDGRTDMAKMLVAFRILASMHKKQSWIHVQNSSILGAIYKVKIALCGGQTVAVFSLSTHKRRLLTLPVSSNSSSEPTKGGRTDTLYAGMRKPLALNSTKHFLGQKVFHTNVYRDICASTLPVSCRRNSAMSSSSFVHPFPSPTSCTLQHR